MRPALALLALLVIAPLAHAKGPCEIDLGQGWPPATRNHGSAVETLFAAGDAPALSLVRLPPRGKETGVLLVRPVNGGAWTVRSSVAAGSKDKHLPKRWSALIKLLDQLDAQLAAAG